MSAPISSPSPVDAWQSVGEENVNPSRWQSLVGRRPTSALESGPNKGSPIHSRVTPKRRPVITTSSVSGIQAVAASLMLHNQELEAMNQEVNLQGSLSRSTCNSRPIPRLLRSSSPGRPANVPHGGLKALSPSQVMNTKSCRGGKGKESISSALEVEAQRLLHRVKELSGHSAHIGCGLSVPCSSSSTTGRKDSAYNKSSQSHGKQNTGSIHYSSYLQPPPGRFPPDAAGSALTKAAIDVVGGRSYGACGPLEGLLSEIELQDTMKRLLQGTDDIHDEAVEDELASDDSQQVIMSPMSSNHCQQVIRSPMSSNHCQNSDVEALVSLPDPRATAHQDRDSEVTAGDDEIKGPPVAALEETEDYISEERGRILRLMLLVRWWQKGVRLQKRARLYAEACIKSRK